VSPSRHIIVAGGLCLASALASGCAADRPARATTDWKQLLFPFRAAKSASAETTAPEGELAESPGAPGVPALQSAPIEDADQYYNPRSTLAPYGGRDFRPPVAPPASDPGYLSDENQTSGPTTTGVKTDNGRPARLRDVFDNFGRRQPRRARPEIPLDEPVALGNGSSAARVVGYERLEAVILGDPIFEYAE